MRTATLFDDPPAPALPAGPVQFLGVEFDSVDQQSALAKILARPPDEPFAYVITPNVDHVVRLQCARSDLWPAYRHAWLTLCDSRILARLAARAHVGLSVATGSDLTVSLFLRGLRSDDRIAVLGGSEVMIGLLRRRYDLTNVVHYNPPMRFIDNAAERLAAIEFVVNARARFTFLAVGSPQQEILAYHIARSREATGVGLCIGASLEFITATRKRAPRIVQAMSMEWLFRLVTDPARLWRRYLLDGPLIFSIFRSWRRETPGSF
jgi:N-acetylglucosaminyldiphosphoundecaprenol N-acetyl-beta-D-mannosaminyltransferase